MSILNIAKEMKINENRFSIYSPYLTDRQRAILRSIKRDYLQYSLLYLKEHNISFEDTKSYKHKIKSIKNEKERTIHILKMMIDYFKKINNIQNDLITMWQEGHNEKNIQEKFLLKGL